MTGSEYHIAQINIGRMLDAIDSETMSGFVARLEEINALADGTDGFVWRLQTEDGDATSLRPYEDERIIVNMSVWETIEKLHDFTYRSSHKELLKDRKGWFEHMKIYMCLSVAALRMSWLSSDQMPAAIALPARLAPSGPGNISGKIVITLARHMAMRPIRCPRRRP